MTQSLWFFGSRLNIVADHTTVHIPIHHRPLGALLRFSIEMRERLKGKIEPDYFYEGK